MMKSKSVSMVKGEMKVDKHKFEALKYSLRKPLKAEYNVNDISLNISNTLVDKTAFDVYRGEETHETII